MRSRLKIRESTMLVNKPCVNTATCASGSPSASMLSSASAPGAKRNRVAFEIAHRVFQEALPFRLAAFRLSNGGQDGGLPRPIHR
jgi:hypothetical protein